MKSISRGELFKLSWLLELDSDDWVLQCNDSDIQRVRYAIPPDVGEAWLSTLALPDGIMLYQAVHDLAPSPQGQLISFMDVDSASDEFLFSAQIWLSGLGCHHEYWKGRDNPPVEIVAIPGQDTFRLKKSWLAKVSVAGGATSEMRSLTVPDNLMKTLMGEAAAEGLLVCLGLNTQRPTVVHPMPRHVSAPLRDAMSSQFSGPARKLYAQARVLDYLAGLLHFVCANNSERSESTSEKKIKELHHYLINLDGAIPSLNDLAKAFGISARRLNTDFIAKYGQSIYSFITDHRLTQAHTILLSAPIPLKTMAMRLGYSHVNHFSSAFKKKFGYPPSRLRISQLKNEA
jgi:AraC-like DNA-binding protein